MTGMSIKQFIVNTWRLRKFLGEYRDHELFDLWSFIYEYYTEARLPEYNKVTAIMRHLANRLRNNNYNESEWEHLSNLYPVEFEEVEVEGRPFFRMKRNVEADEIFAKLMQKDKALRKQDLHYLFRLIEKYEQHL